jgi:dolichol-phosphate mannosyltransferase
MAVVLVLGSMQMVVLGVIGEYLGRLYMESKHRPLFIIQDIKRGGVSVPLAHSDTIQSASSKPSRR